jgi:hypothetical protein
LSKLFFIKIKFKSYFEFVPGFLLASKKAENKKLLVNNRTGFGEWSDGWMGVKIQFKGLLSTAQKVLFYN